MYVSATDRSLPRTMNQIQRMRYGPPDVLELREAEVPIAPADRVLIRVKASSVNALDWHALRGEPMMVRLSDGLRRPKDRRLGTDVAGVIEQVGAGVGGFAPGDRVFGACAGAFAEFAVARPDRLVPIPDGISFEQAAAVPVAASTALQAVRDHAAVVAGDSVLIHGAGGGVGTFAVQIAKTLDARVTASSSAANGDRLRALGADDVVDSASDDFTRGARRYDAIIDIAGTRPLKAGLAALTEHGRYVIVGGPTGRWIKPLDRIVAAVVRRKLFHQRIVNFLARLRIEDFQDLCNRLEAGTLDPVVAATFPLRDVADAIRLVEARRTFGKVVITI
jgi:NADPH:quinone reductase-like Zn-dependent oxidoreductase